MYWCVAYKFVNMSSNGTVLVVDDDTAIVDAYDLHLRGEYEVRTATNGRAALSKLDDRVDVVLLDRRMPGLTGDEVLERVRERDLSCRVAMVTGVEPDVDVIEMGFDDYLRKPVSPDDLRDLVASLLHRAAYDSQLQQYFSLVSKRAVLESEGEAAVKRTEEFSTLSGRIDRMRDDLDGTLTQFSGGDAFVAALSGGGDGRTSLQF
jgi:two-component system response regulator AdeR